MRPLIILSEPVLNLLMIRLVHYKARATGFRLELVQFIPSQALVVEFDFISIQEFLEGKERFLIVHDKCRGNEAGGHLLPLECCGIRIYLYIHALNEK